MVPIVINNMERGFRRIPKELLQCLERSSRRINPRLTSQVAQFECTVKECSRSRLRNHLKPMNVSIEAAQPRRAM